MLSEFPLAVPLQAGTGLAMASLAVIVARALLRHRWRRALLGTAAAAGWIAIYAGAVIAVSLSSTERVLDLNQPKRLCGFYLDCHVMVTLPDVRATRTLGNSPREVAGGGIFYVVTVEQSSDARAARIGLAKPDAVVLDGEGRRYHRSQRGEAALARSVGALAPLGRPVEAGSGYTTQFVFDLPTNITNPRLHVAERDWFTRLSELLLIGDEDSLLHPRTVFRLAS